jgi:hypothetical protein
MNFVGNRRGKLVMGGRFHITHRRLVKADLFDGPAWETLSEEEVDNIVVNQGLNHILGVELQGVTQKPAWYLGLFQGNYTPVATDTAATIYGNATECSSYTSATRPLWQPAAASGQSISNVANPAVFTFNASVTVYGAFLTSLATIGGGGGSDILFAAAQFATSKAVSATDQLLVTYQFNAASA